MIDLLLAAVQETGGQTAATDPAMALGMALVLLLVAVVLTILEVLFVSGGLLGLGALAAAGFAIHFAFLFDPTTGWLFLIGCPIAAVMLIRWGLKRLGESRLVTQDEVTAHAGYREQTSSHGLSIGSRGTLITPAMPCGRARFDTTVLDIEIHGGSGEKGVSIEIIDIQGPRILAILVQENPHTD